MVISAITKHRALPAAMCTLTCLASLAAYASNDAVALRDRLAALEADIAAGAQTSTQLDALGQPIYLQSRESSGHLDGEVWARIDYPLAELHDALGRADRWCEIMILHQNVKYCRSTREAGSDILYVGLGRKTFQALDDVHWLRFAFNNTESSPDLLRVELHAPSGPLSTTDYRMVLEAAPLSSGSSVLHFYYGYSFGSAGRLAMKSYLVTIGRDKVGFSTTGSEVNGKPIYVSGVRGVLERNVMRYFLAIRAYLAAATGDGEDAMDDRLHIWFDATDRYPRQLHELERAEYMDMKARELWRQQSVMYPPEGS